MITVSYSYTSDRKPTLKVTAKNKAGAVVDLTEDVEDIRLDTTKDSPLLVQMKRANVTFEAPGVMTLHRIDEALGKQAQELGGRIAQLSDELTEVKKQLDEATKASEEVCSLREQLAQATAHRDDLQKQLEEATRPAASDPAPAAAPPRRR